VIDTQAPQAPDQAQPVSVNAPKACPRLAMLALGVGKRLVDKWIAAQDRQVIAVGEGVDARRRKSIAQRFEQWSGADQVADVVAPDDEEAGAAVRRDQAIRAPAYRPPAERRPPARRRGRTSPSRARRAAMRRCRSLR